MEPQTQPEPNNGQTPGVLPPANPLDLLQWCIAEIKKLQELRDGWIARQGRCDHCGVIVDLKHDSVVKAAGPPIVTPEGTKRKLTILCGRCAHRAGSRLVGVPS